MRIGGFARRWFALLLVSMAAGAGTTVQAASPVPTPKVLAAPAGKHGYPFPNTTQGIKTFGYVQTEVFIEGTARSFVPSAPLEGIRDGKWNATPTGPAAPYRIRLLLRYPSNPAKFNGTVLFEWLNVSSGYDSDSFDSLGAAFMREGYAFVGVSAQAIGDTFLRDKWDPERYGSLVHPGDSYSYDIFSQAAQAVRAGNPAPLGNLTSRIKALVAWGGSQSGGRLITYINAVHPTARVIDGFVPFITAGGAALSQAPLPVVQVPRGAQGVLRTDTATPILFQNSESEFINSARGLHSQPDSTWYRMWEFTGTSHANAADVAVMKARLSADGVAPVFPECTNPPINNISSFPAWRAMLNAMHGWILRGKAPTSAPRAELAIPADPAQPATIVRDSATGMGKGGIRLPQIAAPTGTHTGTRPPAAMKAGPNCGLFGAVDPWNDDKDGSDGNRDLDISPSPEPTLKARYGTSTGYVKAVQDSANRLVAQGFLTADDAKASVAAAKRVVIQ